MYVVWNDVNTGISTSTKFRYTINLQQQLKYCCEVYMVLIDEHGSMHREYINARQPDPFVYEMGDLVWVRWQIKFDEKKGIVGKLIFQHIGLWEIISNPTGSLYKIRHRLKHNTTDK